MRGDCDWEGLSSYLDEEMTSDESRHFEAHLEACPGCRAVLARMRQIKHSLARLPARETPPAAVLARIEALRFPRPPQRRVILRLAIALVLLILLPVLGLVGQRQWNERSLTRLLVDDHLRSGSLAEPAEITSSDAGELKLFFRGHTPFDPRVPTFEGTILLGARRCEIRGQKAELLLYQFGGEPLSVFILDTPGALSSAGCRSSGDIRVCTAREGGLVAYAVGAIPSDDLIDLARTAVSR